MLEKNTIMPGVLDCALVWPLIVTLDFYWGNEKYSVSTLKECDATG